MIVDTYPGYILPCTCPITYLPSDARLYSFYREDLTPCLWLTTTVVPLVTCRCPLPPLRFTRITPHFGTGGGWDPIQPAPRSTLRICAFTAVYHLVVMQYPHSVHCYSTNTDCVLPFGTGLTVRRTCITKRLQHRSLLLIRPNIARIPPLPPAFGSTPMTERVPVALPRLIAHTVLMRSPLLPDIAIPAFYVCYLVVVGFNNNDILFCSRDTIYT